MGRISAQAFLLCLLPLTKGLPFREEFWVFHWFWGILPRYALG